jgi:hypothetical protein
MGPNATENIVAIKVNLHFFELIFELKVNFHKIRLLGIKLSTTWICKASNVLDFKGDPGGCHQSIVSIVLQSPSSIVCNLKPLLGGGGMRRVGE